ncbi:hypothetical protein BCR37DRAFT_393828 [Protomyces lactucae-debilis]|uniref:Uncharacterized protein n=1 Tax=Protomyces lactucae-debilis TaxID=2754530 RepID=A0A1Y2F971_PROLT|nr:uncharacterized protein BCR37DRAFT_393828 [Protomyces lactucae-debilis]ORY80472.1 hypothetical protein BCR37DRAFT_393828 [Protomyces lactucae-debilis]
MYATITLIIWSFALSWHVLPSVFAHNCRQIALVSWADTTKPDYALLKVVCHDNTEAAPADKKNNPKAKGMTDINAQAEHYVNITLTDITNADSTGCLNLQNYPAIRNSLYNVGSNYKHYVRIDTYKADNGTCYYPVNLAILSRVHKDRGCDWSAVESNLMANAIFQDSGTVFPRYKVAGDPFFYTWVFDDDFPNTHVDALNTDVRCSKK